MPASAAEALEPNRQSAPCCEIDSECPGGASGTGRQGIELADIRIKRPSLEEAFIELTGKSLRE